MRTELALCVDGLFCKLGAFLTRAVYLNRYTCIISSGLLVEIRYIDKF